MAVTALVVADSRETGMTCWGEEDWQWDAEQLATQDTRDMRPSRDNLRLSFLSHKNVTVEEVIASLLASQRQLDELSHLHLL